MDRRCRMKTTKRLATLAGLALVVSTGSADAHFIDPDRSIVHNGMLHTLGSYQQLIPLAALGLAVGRKRPLSAILVFVLGLTVGYCFLGYLPYLWFPYLDAALFIACGLALLGNVLTHLYLEMPPTLAAGLSYGMLQLVDAPDDPRALAFSVFAALAALLVVSLFALVRRWLTWGWINIAERIAGAWVVAIGIMLMAAAAAAPEYVDELATPPIDAPDIQLDRQP